MRQKEKPLERANTRAACKGSVHRGGVGPLSTNNFTKDSGEKQELFVWKYLGYGAETATTARDLAAMIGVSDPRVITRQIEKERLRGHPVCASQNGYFLPADATELDRYLRAFQRRRAQTAQTEKALRLALDTMTAQQRIENGGATDGTQTNVR